MRTLRIAAVSVTAALLCLLVARVLTVDPPRPDNDAVLDPQPDGPNNVPAPPPVPGTKAVQPVKKRPVPQRVATVQPEITQAAPVEQAESNPLIWKGSDAPAVSEDPVASPVIETASVEQPRGPVIVVPHERPKEDSRGIRWIKAVGHALGIGAKDPAEQSFR